MNDAIRLIRESRRRSTDAGVYIGSVPSEVIGAYGERVAARLLRARVVSGPGVDDHDLIRNGCKIEVKASLTTPRHIGNLSGKVRDRVAYVELALIAGRLCAKSCNFYEKPGEGLGRRPRRDGFLQRIGTTPIELRRPIRLPWRIEAN